MISQVLADALRGSVAATGRVEIDGVVAPSGMRLEGTIPARTLSSGPEGGTILDFVEPLPVRDGHLVLAAARIQEGYVVLARHVDTAIDDGIRRSDFCRAISALSRPALAGIRKLGAVH